jgi:phosphoribosylanthranilate isomerase
VAAVGLFVDAPADRVRATLQTVPLDLLQFHGDEEPDFCAAFGRRWIKAVRMRPDVDLMAAAARYRGAAALLLDAFDPARPGGTGQRFDWDRIPDVLASSIVLAGGLDPGNVAEAIARVGPFAVDVSGGVEASKGVKDPEKIRAFMKRVNDVARPR